jgi:maltose alpha-D-glucosyltransferase/alpha-amylase
MLPFGGPGYLSLFFNRPGKRCFFDSHGEGNVCEFLDEYLKHYAKTRRGYVSIPTGNHDLRRLNTARNRRALEVIFAFLMTWPGVPFIYYGDEIGMRYIKGLPSKEGGYGRTGSRTPMQWDDNKNAGFSSAPSNRIYLPIDPQKSRPTVKAQDRRPSSLLNHVRRLIDLRKNSPALQANGTMTPLYAKQKRYPFVFLRQRGRERFIVAINPSDQRVTAAFDYKRLSTIQLELGRGATTTSKGKRIKVSMDGISYGIFSIS